MELRFGMWGAGKEHMKEAKRLNLWGWRNNIASITPAKMILKKCLQLRNQKSDGVKVWDMWGARNI